MTPLPPRHEIDRVVALALAEDAPWGDVTSEALVPEQATASGAMVSRSVGVVAGLPIASSVLAAVDPGAEFAAVAADGARVSPGEHLAEIAGRARALLLAERVALNLVQRMSGIATLTARYVEAVAGTGTRISDTRKTTPGLRSLERYAVAVGGGVNHRRGLSDAVLVKDNHLVALGSSGVSVADALVGARQSIPHTMTIEVEVDSLRQIDEVLDGDADVILLDNFSVADMAKAVEHVAGRALVEASGGVTLDTVRAIAETGVDVISVGALTHSAPALDIGLDLVIGAAS